MTERLSAWEALEELTNCQCDELTGCRYGTKALAAIIRAALAQPERAGVDRLVEAARAAAGTHAEPCRSGKCHVVQDVHDAIAAVEAGRPAGPRDPVGRLVEAAKAAGESGRGLKEGGYRCWCREPDFSTSHPSYHADACNELRAALEASRGETCCDEPGLVCTTCGDAAKDRHSTPAGPSGEALMEFVRMVAYEPVGGPEASHREVVAILEREARELLARCNSSRREGGGD